MNAVIYFIYLISGILRYFRRLLCKKCVVKYYVINHAVMKLLING